MLAWAVAELLSFSPGNTPPFSLIMARARPWPSGLSGTPPSSAKQRTSSSSLEMVDIVVFFLYLTHVSLTYG